MFLPGVGGGGLADKVEVNGCHAPGDTQTPKTVFFLKKNPVFCVFFSPKMLFFYITMTSNAFSRAIKMCF